MRIPSGVTDQYIYFVAVDATDFVTRETGLATWTVYRSRNGGVAAAMTTPTINEVDATNLPGVYELLLDEDMTIDAGDDSQEMVFHITHAGMAPVTRTIEVYRPKITAGNTLDVTATGAAGIDWANVENPTTSQDLSATTISTSQAIASVSGAVGSVTGAVGSVTGSVGSISDVTFPTNFADLAIEVTTGYVSANVVEWLGTAPATPTVAGVPEVDVTYVNGSAATGSGTPDVNVVSISGDTVAADNLEAALDGTGGVTITAAITGNITGNLSGSVGSVTGAVGSVTGAVGSVVNLSADWADGGRLDLLIDAIKAKTDNVLEVGTAYIYTNNATGSGFDNVTITVAP